MKNTLITALLSVGIAAATATTAFAQAPANADARPGPGFEHRHAPHAFARPTERVEARLAYIKTALKITDAQQAQWEAFANFVRKNAQDREERFKSRRAGERGPAGHGEGNVIERMERAQSFHAEAVTRINQALAVEKPLYAALSPEQQKVADVVLNPRARGQAGHPMHGRGSYGRG